MPTKQDKLKGLLKIKTDLIDGNTEKLFNDLGELQLSLYPDIRDYLDDLDTTNGRYLNNSRNRNKVLGFKKFLLGVLESKYGVSIESYVKTIGYVEGFVNTIDQIDDKNYRIQKLNNITIKPNDFVRKFTVQNVVEGLSLERITNDGLKPLLQRQIFNYVTGKQSRFDAQKKLKKAIQSDDGLKRWSKTIASDALSQYDGQIQKELASEFEFEGYHYVGSLIETSRPQCRHWVDGLNGFIEFKSLASEVEKWKNARGYDNNLALTVIDFPVVRGGYNCRHSATPGFKF